MNSLASNVLRLHPTTRLIQFALCACASVVSAAPLDTTIFSGQHKIVESGSFNDGLFTVAIDGTGITTEQVETSQNSLVARGAVDVNGPLGAVAIRKMTAGDYPALAVVKQNALTVNDGVVATAIRGVHISNMNDVTASDNTVTMKGGTIHGQFFTKEDKKRPFMSYGVYAGQSLKVQLERNVLNMQGGDFSGSLFGVGGWESESVTANHNTVNISGGTLRGSIFAVTTWNTSLITANHNTVNVVGGRYPDGINHLIGVWLKVQSSADAHYNHVLLDADATINKVLTAALVYNDDNDKNGVFTKFGDYASLTNNTITLKGTPHFAPGSYLIGAGIDYEGFERSFDDLSDFVPKFDFFSGNTLDMQTSGVYADKVGNFQYYRFLLPESFKANYDTVLTANELHLEGKNEAAGKKARISEVYYSGQPTFAVGDSIHLLYSEYLAGEVENNGQILWMQPEQGVTLGIPTVVQQSAHGVDLKVLQGLQARPEVKAFSEGYLASLALSVQGADLVATQGIKAAMQAGEINRFNGFAAMSGASSRYKTGSHIDLNSVSLMVGGAYTGTSANARWTVGGFFEAGRASYDTTNTTSNASSLKGNGRAHYEGVGLLARMDLNNGFYTEASLRTGSIHNEYDSQLYDRQGKQASYDFSRAYVGAHAGIGYRWRLSPSVQTDIYAKYLFAHQRGKHLALTTGDAMSFDAVNSHRIQVGTRLSFLPTTTVKPYIGLAYEHEFSGKATATAYGFPVDAPSMKGSTGMAEMGLSILPDKKQGWSADAGVKGYAGQRQEISAQLNAIYRF